MKRCKPTANRHRHLSSQVIFKCVLFGLYRCIVSHQGITFAIISFLCMYRRASSTIPSRIHSTHPFDCQASRVEIQCPTPEETEGERLFAFIVRAVNTRVTQPPRLDQKSTGMGLPAVLVASEQG